MLITVAIAMTRTPAELPLALWLFAQDPGEASVPTTIIGLVALVITGLLSLTGLVYRSQLLERKDHTAEMKDLSLKHSAEMREQATRFAEVIREMERRHDEEQKATTIRQQQIEDKLTQVIVEVTTTMREVSKAVENFIPLRAIQDELRGGSKAVR